MINQKNIAILVTINIPLGDFLAINMGKVGYEILIAPDVQSALFLIKTAHPTYIIIDTLLPSNGAENLLSKLEPINRVQNIPIILLDASLPKNHNDTFTHYQKIRQDVEPKELVTSLTDKIEKI